MIYGLRLSYVPKGQKQSLFKYPTVKKVGDIVEEVDFL